MSAAGSHETGSRMQRVLVSRRTRWTLYAMVGVLGLLLAWLNHRVDRDAYPGASGAARSLVWRQALEWNFAEGEFPDGWGWGDWEVVDGCLELRDPTGDIAVYFTPVEHAPDFVMVAEFMLVEDLAGGPAAVHLLTRDCREMTHESGVVVRAGRDSMSVRHKVNLQEYLLDVVPLARPVAHGEWHRVRFTVARGEVTVHLDGVPVYVSEERFPQGLYTEPHVAAERGVVRIRSIQVLDAPRASGPQPASGDQARGPTDKERGAHGDRREGAAGATARGPDRREGGHAG